jgi:hypothetical protein
MCRHDGSVNLPVNHFTDVSTNSITAMRGFSLIEIILAFAISTIVFVSVFEFVTVSKVHGAIAADRLHESFTQFEYGRKICSISDVQIDRLSIGESMSLQSIISSTTPITSMHIVGGRIILTTDSASTSEPDVYVLETATMKKEFSADIGPGIQDSILIGSSLVVANTSVNSHVKVLSVTLSDSGSLMLSEVQSIKISSLAQSGSLPKIFHMHGRTLMLGTEKNAGGGELFPMIISPSGIFTVSTSGLELGGQAHQSIEYKDSVLVSNAADPELRIYDAGLTEINSYDAPLTLGNGKSVFGSYPYVILGRTLGSGELSLLKWSATSSMELLDMKRTFGTVDFIQPVEGESARTNLVLFTANADAELQTWKLNDDRLEHMQSLNLPGRVTAYDCLNDSILAATIINTIPTLLWIR